jgi:hypothetical protein
MTDSTKGVLDELVSILEKIRDNKVYGSVELFFEEGEITQITQRIIRKVKKTELVKKTTYKPTATSQKINKDAARQAVSTLE